MLIYIVGKYTGKSRKEIDENINKARQAAIKLWERGHVALCPHLNTMHFEEDCKCTYEQYLDGDFKLLNRCDAIFMLKDWAYSQGASKEQELAFKLGMKIYYQENGYDIPLHPTEVNNPIQCDAFINQIMKMYRVHLEKNRDYGPANILLTGEIGVATRIWDKVGRLLNLLGFKLHVEIGEFASPKAPCNESIEDTFDDLATYGVIAKLVHNNQWGK